MTDTKHTPGPWEVSQYGFSDEQRLEETHVIAEKDEVNDDFRIADCYGPDHKINAALIAAAPELLEALHNSLRCFERDDTTMNQEDRRSGLGVRVFITYKEAERCRAAIAKATALNNPQTR